MSSLNTEMRTHTSDLAPLVEPPVQAALHPTTAEAELAPMFRPASGELHSFSLLKKIPMRASRCQPLPVDWL